MTNISSKLFYVPLLTLLLILHFSVLGESTHNPVGFKFLNEAYLAICLGLSLLLLLASTDETAREYRVLMYYGLYSALVFTLLPAVFAYHTFGQPIIYGLIEERRILFAFGFVPLLLIAKQTSTLQFERALVYAALIAVIFSWLYKFGLIPDLSKPPGTGRTGPLSARSCCASPIFTAFRFGQKAGHPSMAKSDKRLFT